MESEINGDQKVKSSLNKFLTAQDAIQAILNIICYNLMKTDPIKFFDYKDCEETMKTQKLIKTDYVDDNKIITIDLFKHDLKYYSFLYCKISKYIEKCQSLLTIFDSIDEFLYFYRFLLYLEALSNNTKIISSNIYKSNIYDLIKFIILQKDKIFDEDHFLRIVYSLVVEFDSEMIEIKNIDNDLKKMKI